MTGDEDEPCPEPGLMMKRTIPSAALVLLPNSGHAINIEELLRGEWRTGDLPWTPGGGRWALRDMRTLPIASALGILDESFQLHFGDSA
jgi:hypothetical protein